MRPAAASGDAIRAVLLSLMLLAPRQVAPSLDQLSSQCIGTCKEWTVESLAACAPPASLFQSASSGNLLPQAGPTAPALTSSTAASPNGGGSSSGSSVGEAMSERAFSEPVAIPGSGASLAAHPRTLAAGEWGPTGPGSLVHGSLGPTGPPPPGLGGRAAGPATTQSVSAGTGAPRALMTFAGCPRPLGCTIVLRSCGSDARQLAALKRVAAFAAYAAYWSRLESAFLADALLAAAAAVLPAGLGAPPEARAEMLGGIAEAVASSSYLSVAEQRGRQAIVSASPHVSVYAERGAPLDALLLPPAEAGLAPELLLPGVQRSTDSDPWGLPASLGVTALTLSGSAFGTPSAAEEAAVVEQQQQQDQRSQQDTQPPRAEAGASGEPASAAISPPASEQQGLERAASARSVGATGEAGGSADGRPAHLPHPGTTIYKLQQLWLSISCKNPAKAVLCEPPHSHCMEFYASAGA